MELLLDHEASIDMLDGDRNTPLILAIEHGETAIARLLMNRGAQLAMTPPGSSTALLAAVEAGNDDLIQEWLVKV